MKKQTTITPRQAIREGLWMMLCDLKDIDENTDLLDLDQIFTLNEEEMKYLWG